MSYVSENLDLRKISTDIDRMTADYQRLIEFEKDMIQQLKFKVGDRVTLKENYTGAAQGWTAYKPMLVSGNPATIKRIVWNSWSKKWQADLLFDVQWSESWWSNNKMNVYIQKNSESVFAWDLKKIRPLRDDDVPPKPPKPGRQVHPFIPNREVEVDVKIV